MAKNKNKTRTAYKNAPNAASDEAASKLVPVSDGHVFVFDGKGKTKCGEYGLGWFYGTKANVLCPVCKEEREQTGATS